jgi:hypothetical protein
MDFMDGSYGKVGTVDGGARLLLQGGARGAYLLPFFFALANTDSTACCVIGW